MANEIVKFDSADGQEVSFTAQEVRERLCPNIEDKELALVMALCQAQKLNPFTKDVYITKYGDKPAQIVTGKEVFTKRAQANPKFEGMEAGISVMKDGQLIRREGSMVLPGEQLFGGWCKVYINGYRVPMFDEVSFAEYAGRKKDGTLNSMWNSKGATMIRKVAVCHALREAFPDDFQGLYGAEELNKAEVEAETQNTASDGEKTASNAISNEPMMVEFVEVASEEAQGNYVEMVREFAEMCGKEWGEAHNAVAHSNCMAGAGDDYTAWSPDQMENAMQQLSIWIDKATVKVEEVAPLADEDIPF